MSKLDPKEAPRGYRIRVVREYRCDGCAFDGKSGCRRLRLKCTPRSRSDGRNIIFVKAPKARKKPLTFAAWWKKNSNPKALPSARWYHEQVEEFARRAFAAGRRRRK